MRIGIDARYLGVASTGLARYSENLLEALARLDGNNHYTVFVHASLNRRLRLGPNFRLAPMRGRPNSLSAMFRLARAVRHEGLDLLHVHFPLAPLGVECPVLITVHDMLPYVPESKTSGVRFQPWNLVWTYMFYPMALARAKWIICVSRATRESLTQLFPSVFHKTIIIHSGASETFRLPIAAATSELIRSRLALPEQYLLYSGSTRADKNIQGMLLAFATLRQRNPHLSELCFVLDISGEQYSLAHIDRLIQQFGLEPRVRVIQNAGDEERRVIFEDARALFILSRYEGFGFPILEAQATDLPVLAADSGALPEIAGEKGAVLVDPDNPEQVVTMLERVLVDEELRAYLIENGRANAHKYDWTRTADQLKQIYELLFYPLDQLGFPRRRIQLPRFF
jgi:glycosyltransferase involved in cell wall biosynthesis